MPTPSVRNNNASEQGYSLPVTVIILALLGALGAAGLRVAGLNILIAANERDAKDALFLADSGVNIGRTFLEAALDSANSSFYDDGSNATLWQEERSFDPDAYPTAWDRDGLSATYVRCGLLQRRLLPGSAIQAGTGYEGAGYSVSHGAAAATFLIRSHRVGRRSSSAEVDLGWEHVIP